MKYLLLSTLIGLMLSCKAQNDKTITRLTPDEFLKLVEEKGIEVIDVRTPGEVGEGYIKGTQHFIDFNGATFNQEIDALDTSKAYIVYCRSGNRSTRAIHVMLDKGFKNLYELQGGISGFNKPENIVK